MEKTIRELLLEIGNTKIPKSLKIVEDEQVIKIILRAKRVQITNMQENGNDFEGWVMATYCCIQQNGINKDIMLDLEGTFQYESYEKNGHLGRFLYRAMKFVKQYDWLELSDYLKAEVKKFEVYLHNGKFLNNVAQGTAGDKNKADDENRVEIALAQNGRLKKNIKTVNIGENEVYRQLPVGLFAECVKRDNAVFTGGKSAIDLWTWNDDEITVVELKTQNVMMGIITEIFFYSNYIYDLVREDGLFTKNEELKKLRDHRGYKIIKENTFTVVNGVLLADDDAFHPWIAKIMDILNDNHNSNLRYYLESYNLKKILEEK